MSTITSPAPAPRVATTPPRGRRAWLPWLLGTLALLGVSIGLVLWARTRPGYDPYGWLVWGKLTVHGALDTNGAPSWKPLPFLFTVPYALFGHFALWLWMVTAFAVSLAGPVFAWRIAARLTDPDGTRPLVGVAAGAVAAVTLLGIRDYTHFIFSAQSDTMIVSLCLAALDCGLQRRFRWALWLWTLAALGRPEVWPFLGAYLVWAWRAQPQLRRLLVVATGIIPVLWFGIPALTAKSAFIAGDNALHSPRELHANKSLGTLDRFLDLHELAVWVAALVAVGLAVVRRQRFVLVLALGAVVWVAVEVAFVLRGYPGVPRYLFEPVGVVCVLAGVAVGWLWGWLPAVAAGVQRVAVPAVAALAVAAVLTVGFAAALAPAAGSRVRVERADLRHERARTDLINRLHTLVSRLGAGHILRCGNPDVPISYQSIFAWYTGLRIGALYVNERAVRLHPVPLVRITPRGGSWQVRPVDIPPSRAPQCQSLTVR